MSGDDDMRSGMEIVRYDNNKYWIIRRWSITLSKNSCLKNNNNRLTGVRSS